MPPKQYEAGGSEVTFRNAFLKLSGYHENGLCLKQLYVHIKYAPYVKEGLCEFHCFPNLKLLRDEKHI